MTDLNTYLQEIKEKLKVLETKFDGLAEASEHLKVKHLQELENILSEVKIELNNYKLEANSDYPVALSDFKINNEDILEALNKIFKLD